MTEDIWNCVATCKLVPINRRLIEMLMEQLFCFQAEQDDWNPALEEVT